MYTNTITKIVRVFEETETQEMYDILIDKFSKVDMFHYPLPITVTVGVDGSKVFMMINGWEMENPEMLIGDKLLNIK